MSLFESKTNLLSLSPSVWWTGKVLHVRTNWLLRVLSLGSYDREVVVDPVRKRLEVHARRLFMLTSHRIVRFEDIAYLDYRFASMGTSWNATPGHFERSDQLESFRIAVALRGTEEKIPIATFRGEGSVSTGPVGVILGDDVVDMAGDQEDRSRHVVDVLQKLLGVPLGRPLLSAGTRPAIRICAACGRSAAPANATCLYCGGAIKGV